MVGHQVAVLYADPGIVRHLTPPLSDTHIRRVSAHHYVAILTVVTHYTQEIEHCNNLLNDFEQLSQ